MQNGHEQNAGATATPQDTNTMAQKLDKSGHRIVTFTEIPLELKKQVQAIISETQTLKTFVVEKQEAISAQKNSIVTAIDEIATLPLFPPKADVRGVFTHTAQEYQLFITEALEDLTTQEAHFQRYENNEQKQFVARKTEYGNSIDTLLVAYHVQQEIQTFRKHLKKRRQQLSVLFSRFEHGFKTHMQHIERLTKQLNQVKIASSSQNA